MKIKYRALEASESVRWWLHERADRLYSASAGPGRRGRFALTRAVACDRIALALHRIEHRIARGQAT